MPSGIVVGSTSSFIGESYIGGAANQIGVRTAAGSLVFNGTSGKVRQKLINASGSVALSGTAVAQASKFRQGSGTVVLSGTAGYVRAKYFTASSGIVFSGTAGVAFVGANRLIYTSSGAGFSLTGSATRPRTSNLSSTGQVALSGTVGINTARVMNSVGGIVFSGVSTGKGIRPFMSTGSITFLGTTHAIKLRNFLSSGGVITFSGAAGLSQVKSGSSIWEDTGLVSIAAQEAATIPPTNIWRG